MMSGWLAIDNPPEVVPCADLREHVYGMSCWCDPTMDLWGVIIHNSADERELFERGERKVS